MASNKPTVFNYNDYLQAKKENEWLSKANHDLLDKILKQKHTIEKLKAEVEELKLKGATVTDVIDAVKTKMCERCTHLEKCGTAIENGDDYECPMDKL